MEGTLETVEAPNPQVKKQELSPMPEERRAHLIELLRNLNESLPEAILSGSTGLRVQYEVKTGKKMFGGAKCDIDAYVSSEDLKNIIDSPPERYRIKEESEPSERYLALEDTETLDHLDLFAKNPYYEPQVERITIEGTGVQVLTVEELLAERLVDMRRQLDKGKSIKPRHRGYLKLLLEEMDLDEAKLDKIWQARRKARSKEARRQITKLTSTLRMLAEKGDIQDFPTLVDEAVQKITKGEGVVTKSGQKLIEQIRNLRQTVPPAQSEEYAGSWQEAVNQFGSPVATKVNAKRD